MFVTGSTFWTILNLNAQVWYNFLPGQLGTWSERRHELFRPLSPLPTLPSPTPPFPLPLPGGPGGGAPGKIFWCPRCSQVSFSAFLTQTSIPWYTGIFAQHFRFSEVHFQKWGPPVMYMAQHVLLDREWEDSVTWLNQVTLHVYQFIKQITTNSWLQNCIVTRFCIAPNAS
jgi:hypothetical protein